MLKNNRGFGLIEIMIAVAILGSLVAGFTQFFVFFQKQQTQLFAKMDAYNFFVEVSNRMNTAETCPQVFPPAVGGRRIFRAVANANTTLPNLSGQQMTFRTLDGTLVPIGSKIPGTQLIIEDFRVSNFSSLGNTSPAGKELGEARAYMALSVDLGDRKLPLNPKLISTFIFKGQRRFSNIELEECSIASSEESIDDIAEAICPKFGGTWVIEGEGEAQVRRCDF